MGGFSSSVSVSSTVSETVADTISNSLSKSITQTCQASCGDELKDWTMWQWQMDIGEVCKFGKVCPFSVYSCNFMCRSGPDQAETPRCPLTQCADPECNVCKKPEFLPVPSVLI